jgi:hypothetical protein
LDEKTNKRIIALLRMREGRGAASLYPAGDGSIVIFRSMSANPRRPTSRRLSSHFIGRIDSLSTRNSDMEQTITVWPDLSALFVTL